MMAVFLPLQHCCFAIDIWDLLHTKLICKSLPLFEGLGLGHIEVVGAGILCGHMVHTLAGEVHTLAGLVHILEGK